MAEPTEPHGEPDVLVEAGEESFPASDAPPWTLGIGESEGTAEEGHEGEDDQAPGASSSTGPE